MKKELGKQTRISSISPLGEEDKYLTPSDVAGLLKIQPATVYSWLHRGVKIPHIKIQGTIRFRERAIQDWLLEREMEQKRRNFEL